MMAREYGKEVAKELKGLRAKNGLSLQMASEKAKMHRVTISKYEKDASSMQLRQLGELLNSYNEDLYIFFSKLYDNSLKK